MFCTSSKAVAVFGESEIDGGGGKEVSPVGEMKSSASHDVRRRTAYYNNYIDQKYFFGILTNLCMTDVLHMH